MAFLLQPGDQRVELTGGPVTLGRDPSNDICFPDDRKLSRTHAEFRMQDDNWLLVDLNSRNGTVVNNRPVRQHPLRTGDVIRAGNTVLHFVAGTDANETDIDTRVGATMHVELSEREQEVLKLVAAGMTDNAIGEELFISPSTVRSHLDRIKEKTGLRRRAELTRLAIELRLADKS